MARKESGIEELRRAVRASAWCRESAFDGYTAEECLNMIRACWGGVYDILPDDLTPEERAQAAVSGKLDEAATARLKKRYG